MLFLITSTNSTNFQQNRSQRERENAVFSRNQVRRYVSADPDRDRKFEQELEEDLTFLCIFRFILSHDIFGELFYDTQQCNSKEILMSTL